MICTPSRDLCTGTLRICSFHFNVGSNTLTEHYRKFSADDKMLWRRLSCLHKNETRRSCRNCIELIWSLTSAAWKSKM
jgi:hypothetical protein